MRASMKVAVLDVLKKRNNAVSVLCSGLCLGMTKLGIEHQVVKYRQEFPDGRRIMAAEDIPDDTNILLVPYWISDKLWDINLRDVRQRFPNIKIICYSGTSPFWNGSKPCYIPETRGLDASGLTQEQQQNAAAIDLFGVVRPRPGVNYLLQRCVGMGMAPEIQVGQKAPHPFVVLDAMKTGWDEETYGQAIPFLEKAMANFKNLKIAVLGTNKHIARLQPASNVRVLPGDFMAFEEVVKLWKMSWVFICHNESFGYPIVENTACGTRVLASPSAEIPEWHRGIVGSIRELESCLESWQGMTTEERQFSASKMRDDYIAAEPDLFSWPDTVEKLFAGL